jgi:hypothetical protein
MNKRYIMGALAMAGLAFGGATNAQTSQRVNTVNEVKATVETKKAKQTIAINAMGGLDFNPYRFSANRDPNWLPKFGHPKRKTNKLRCKHNAKLKRR